jgi:futalosine hydrolase
MNMRLLVAAATVFELEQLQQFLEQQFEKTGTHHYSRNNLEVYICITGIGVMQTTFHLMEAIAVFNPHFCLQAGIAGAFGRDLPLTELVIVQEETIGDLGVEDNGRFRDVFDIELMNAFERPFAGKKLINTFSDFPLKLNLPFVSGLTVNTVSGTAATISSREEHYDCAVESMEGAAFHYVCLQKKIPFLQVRSISNYVEPRDKSKWKIREAIERLNEWMIANIPG